MAFANHFFSRVLSCWFRRNWSKGSSVLQQAGEVTSVVNVVNVGTRKGTNQKMVVNGVGGSGMHSEAESIHASSLTSHLQRRGFCTVSRTTCMYRRTHPTSQLAVWMLYPNKKIQAKMCMGRGHWITQTRHVLSFLWVGCGWQWEVILRARESIFSDV